MSEERPASSSASASLAAAARLLGVEERERASVALMLLHSFAMGLSTVFFETAASALFLERFDPGALPWVYLAAALASGATGVLFARLQRTLSFRSLLSGAVVLLLTVTLGLRAGLALSSAAWLPFALMAWYRVISILTDLEYWATAARVYDVRQAKRLYGVIGSGEVVARIAGAFSVPLLLGLTEVANLLLLSALALAACLALMNAVLKRAGGAESDASAPSGEESGGTTETLRRVLATGYLRVLVGVAFLAVLGKYFVDFAFLAQIQGEYSQARELASFFALFSGITQTLSLLTRLLVSGRILSRFGVRAGLLVLPAAQLACTGLLIVSGLVPGAGGALFWLVIANQGVYKTLKHPLDNPSFKILYQPLRRRERLAAQISVETIVSPLAIAVASAVMLQFSVAMDYDPRHFALALLAAFGAWVWLARRAGQGYAGALVEALRGRIEDVSYSFSDARNLHVLRRTLARGRPREVLFALDLLERVQARPRQRLTRRPPPRLEPGESPPQVPPRLATDDHETLLLELLGHESEDVRLSVLQRLERHGSPRSLTALERSSTSEASAALRGAALRSLCAHAEQGRLLHLLDGLAALPAQEQQDALVGLQRRGLGRDRLEALARSDSVEERRRAARVIRELTDADLVPLLRELLSDADPETRRIAIVAVGARRDGALWGEVVGAVAEPRSAGVAANSLVAGGESVVPLVVARISKGDDAREVVRLARILGRIGGAEATRELLARIDYPDELVRLQVLESLVAARFSASGENAGRVREQLDGEARDAAWALAALRDVHPEPELRLLESALQSEVMRNRERLFLLLALLHDPQTILRARDNLDHESKEKRAYALEVLDVTLRPEVKAVVLPLVDGRPDAVEGLPRELQEEPAAPAQRVAQVLERGVRSVTSWTLACALHVTTDPDEELRDRARELEAGSGYRLVREAARAARERRGAEGGERGRSEMNIVERVLTLKSVDMFSQTSEEVLADIAAILSEVAAEAGEVILQKGEVGDSMYIIIEGRVRVFDDDRTIARLGERDIFGELALLDPEPRFASIAAEKETRLFRLDREAFLELMAGNIEIVRGILHVLCKRLRRSVRSFGPY